jgi:hypothetical protein
MDADSAKHDQPSRSVARCTESNLAPSCDLLPQLRWPVPPSCHVTVTPESGNRALPAVTSSDRCRVRFVNQYMSGSQDFFRFLSRKERGTQRAGTKIRSSSSRPHGDPQHFSTFQEEGGQPRTGSARVTPTDSWSPNCSAGQASAASTPASRCRRRSCLPRMHLRSQSRSRCQGRSNTDPRLAD